TLPRVHERLAARRAPVLLPSILLVQQDRVVHAALRALTRLRRIDRVAAFADVRGARRVAGLPGVLRPDDIGAAFGAGLRAGQAGAHRPGTTGMPLTSMP